jgi:serine/threonine-protein kinase
MMRFRGDPQATSDVVLVSIDDDSIERLGRWPWPRSLIAEGVRKINAGRPKIIGLNFIFTEPEESDGLKEIRKLEKLFVENVLNLTEEKRKMFLKAMNSAKVRLDNDKKLSDAIQESGKVVLPVFFKESAVGAEETTETHGALIDQSIQNIRNINGMEIPRANEIILPIPSFFEAAKGIGHINLAYDMDGTARRERLLYAYRGLYIPSYTLKLAALYLNLPSNRIRANLGSAVYLNSLEIPTTLWSELQVNFKGPIGSFKEYSFFDVLNEKIPLSIFKNKIVLVGPFSRRAYQSA